MKTDMKNDSILPLEIAQLSDEEWEKYLKRSKQYMREMFNTLISIVDRHGD